ncbi:MAG: hypothetical protein HY864_09770 [Chloroflexi bacterium]|nr:hypothetical protein [Chloroflexota bacterium]
MPAITDNFKNKKKANKTTWRKGMPSPNPAGRSKEGQSWKSIIADVSNMKGKDILSLVGRSSELGRAFLKLPQDVQVKYLVVARVISVLATEPNAGLFNALMDRAEGKVAERVQIDGGLEVDGLSEMLEKVYGKQ